jgi:adenylate kinase
MKIVLLSPPAGGRGSHRVRVQERYPLLCYADPHELVRNEIQAKTPFGVEAQAYLRAGTPLSDDKLLGLVTRYLASPACAGGFILENMPRTPEQAERIVAECRGIDAVVELDVPDKDVLLRTSGRLIHRPSGRIYHETLAPPRVAGKDDATGEPLTRRLDDEHAVALERLKAYRAGVDATKRYFRGEQPYAPSESGGGAAATTPEPRQWRFPPRPPALHTVDGRGMAEEVRARLFATLDELVGKRATGPHQTRFWWSWFS